MSRRDTILMAVLINAGLLVILFATAITKDDTTQTLARATPPAPVSKVLASGDEDVHDRFGVAQIGRASGNGESTFKRTTQVATAPANVPTVFPEEVVKEDVNTPSHDIVDITVKRGDSLDKIARANGTTIAHLQELNQLETTRLQIGQILRVPVVEGEGSLRGGGEFEPEPVRESFYTVQSGDNPWVIAMKHHVPLDVLLKMNNLDEEGARRLRPGDKIRIQ